MFDKIFEKDHMTKRERVLATLKHQPVDRAALHDQVSYNPGVIEMYTGRKFSGFTFTEDDICEVIRKTLDMCFRPSIRPSGKRVTTDDGFVFQYDEWTYWLVSRPFNDEIGAHDWLRRRIGELRKPVDAAEEREVYYSRYTELKQKIGDTVLCDYGGTGFCGLYADGGMGLEIFTFFCLDYPEVMTEYMEASIAEKVAKAHAIAPGFPEPVYLIAEDFATKQAPIFSPDFLRQFHYPYVKRLSDAWHEHGVTVLYHSDGNFKMAIPDLIACGVDGFYCLEPTCGMDAIALKKEHPEMVWAGGIDGIDLMERGTPENVRAEVLRHIRESDVLNQGGMFIASSSEINPSIKPVNYKAMVDAVDELRNPLFNCNNNLR